MLNLASQRVGDDPMLLNEEDDIFMAPAEKPRKSTNRGQSGVRSPTASLHVDLLEMCKCVAEKLEVHPGT